MTRMIKAIVLAGGFGTRLKHITKDTPKPMAPINGVPFLAFVLDHLIKYGITDITLAVSYKRDVIKDYFKDSYHDASIRYSVEDTPLGTGGAIVKAIDGATDADYLIINGDTLFPVNIGEMYQDFISSPANIQIAVKHMDETGRYGRIDFDEKNVVQKFVEKGENVPGYINGGIYILNPVILSSFEDGQTFSFEDKVLTKNIKSNHTIVYSSEEYFIDIGIPDDYERAKKEIS